MPSWRPAGASDPDGVNEWRFRDVSEVDPSTTRHLIEEFGRVWLIEAELPEDHLAEVGDTVALVVAEEWEHLDGGTKRLRLTSWYTGSTYWLRDWDGDLRTATEWVGHVAQLQAVNVRVERFRNGPTPWDREIVGGLDEITYEALRTSVEEAERRETITVEELQTWLREDAGRHPLK